MIAQQEPRLVVNCWAVYTDGANEETPAWTEFKRPQDWGDPRWMYRVYKFEAPKQGFINECHCWVDAQMTEAQHAKLFAPLMVNVIRPGTRRELAGPGYLAEDDIWNETWGIRPPYAPETDAEFYIDSPMAEVDPDVVDSSEFGACCACGKDDGTVRNLVSLDFIAPVEGTGWGCFTCGLPQNGAMAVLCDGCIESGAPVTEILKEICYGYAAKKERVSFPAPSERVPFDHIASRH